MPFLLSIIMALALILSQGCASGPSSEEKPEPAVEVEPAVKEEPPVKEEARSI